MGKKLGFTFVVFSLCFSFVIAQDGRDKTKKNLSPDPQQMKLQTKKVLPDGDGRRKPDEIGIRYPNIPDVPIRNNLAAGDKMTVKNSAGETLMEVNDEGGFGSIALPSGTSITTSTNKLYNLSGTLYWNGYPLAAGGSNWSLNGNSGTTPGTNFLGTTDDTPLEIKVYNKRIMRFEEVYRSANYGYLPNVIAGYSGNTVDAGIWGATISGGGMSNGFENTVSEDAGTIGGGYKNKITGWASTIAGGMLNTAGGGDFWGCATVAGGETNTAEGKFSTIGGGEENEITSSGYHSTISGGHQNTIDGGEFAAIPGGELNSVTADYSFAAGRRAKANHTGCFVWADNTDADFSTQNANTFIIRASNGVGIGLENPQYPLHLASGAHVTSGGAWINASSREYKENIRDLTLEEALTALQQLRPKKFNYKTEKDEQYLGFIAEEVPELVATKDRKSLSPMDIVAVLAKVVQAQQKKIQELEKKINQR